MSWFAKNLFWPVVSAAAGATGAVLIRHAWEKKLGPSHGVPHPLLADTLDARLLASSLALLPTKKTVLMPPSLQLDAVLGGHVGDGDGRWRYWSKELGDPGPVVLSYLIGKAGWPLDLVNRAKDDAWVPGDGFVPGSDVEKIRSGARNRGWLVTPVFSRSGDTAPAVGSSAGDKFMLEPGDVFGLGTDGTMESSPLDAGVVLEVADGNGSRNVVTAEGGLTKYGEPCARWRIRVFRDDGSFTWLGGERRRLLWVVRPT